MSQRPVNATLLASEIELTASRSGGPGGQNVNKVSTKITLRFSIRESAILTPEEKELLESKLKSRMTADGELLLTAQEKRSQLQNREDALKKFDELLVKAFTKKKKRKPTKPSKSAVQKRIQSKKENSEKKKWRQKPS